MYHDDPRTFIDCSAKYAPIGAALVELSNLEYAHDEFCLTYLKFNEPRTLEISENFPRQYREKVDFLVQAILGDSRLRKEPIFPDGTLNIQWLQYQLDELYEIRTVLAHGSIFYQEKDREFSVWQFDRIRSPRKKYWGPEAVRMGSSFLADAYLTAYTLKHYLNRLTLVVDGRDDWEASYKADVEIRKNRKCLRELMKFGIIDPDPLHLSFLEDDHANE